MLTELDSTNSQAQSVRMLEVTLQAINAARDSLSVFIFCLLLHMLFMHCRAYICLYTCFAIVILAFCQFLLLVAPISAVILTDGFSFASYASTAVLIVVTRSKLMAHMFMNCIALTV